jgi:hypothetical protein
MMMSAVSAWQEGVSVWGAVEKYSNETLWNEYVTLTNVLFPPISEDLIDELREWKPDPPLDEDPVERFLKLNHRRNLIEDQVKSEILTLLKTEFILAVAYTSPRLRGRDPIWIEPDCWGRGKVDWTRSELWVDGSRFEEVRIIQPLTSTAAEAVAAIPPIVPERKPGRPSRAEEIELAHVPLRKAGKIDFTRSLRANLHTIQQAVHELNGNPQDLKGLRYEAVRLAVGEQFRQDQARSNSSC